MNSTTMIRSTMMKLNSLSAGLKLCADLAQLLGDVLLRLDLRLQVVLQLEQGHLVQLLRPPVLPVLLGRSRPSL